MEGDTDAAINWRHARTKALICLACAAALALPVVFGSSALERMELGLGDLLTDNRGGGTIDDSLVLIGIDKNSLNVMDVLDEEYVINNPVLDEMSFGNPFPRSVYAALTEKLLSAGARIVVFDIVFAGERQEDADFKTVLDAHPGKFVVASNFDFVEAVGDKDGVQRRDITLPSFTLLDQDGPMDQRVGFANFSPDIDDRVRSMTPTHRPGDRDDSPVYHSMAYATLKQLGLGERISEPERDYHIRFADFSGTPPPYSWMEMYTLFVETDWENNYKGGAVFKDKIVYVGGISIPDFHDVAEVPGAEILGVHLQMNALAAALNGEFYSVFTKRGQLLSIALMALVAFGIGFVMRRPLVGLGILVGCGLLYLLVVRWLYFSYEALVPSAAPILTLALSGIFSFGYQFTIERLEKARLRRTLERQVSKELAEHILSMPEDYFSSLPGVRKPVTVLFSDIRSFTTRAESADVVQLVAQLREYLDAMAKIVFKHGGVVDKFIGDAVMAVWGNFRSDGVDIDARNAVAAASEMLERLAELNEKWVAAGSEPFEIGIGLNHGEVIFAMMGSEEKQEMTVIGDPVNQAARLEGLTKKFGVGIVVGEHVADFVKADFHLRSIGSVRTKGKEQAAELFGVLGPNGGEPDAVMKLKLDWVQDYHSALEAFRRGDLASAETQFRLCLSRDPSDRVCALYLEHIASGEAAGALTMTEK